MKTDRELNYRLYLHRMDGFVRSSYEQELGHYRAIQSGNVEAVKQRFAEIEHQFLAGAGTLSPDPLRNMMYHFVTSMALIGRFCVEGGMEHDKAFTLADIYIQKADSLRSQDEILQLMKEMQVDYAERMRALRKNNVVSLHIRKCIDYIYEHLHEKLTVPTLAEQVGLHPSYLSKLFAKEKGVTIHEFVTQARIATAENLLRHTDYSNSEIALALGFCSQSAFISAFRQKNGITPKKYRELHYSDIMKSDALPSAPSKGQ